MIIMHDKLARDLVWELNIDSHPFVVDDNCTRLLFVVVNDVRKGM